MARLKVGVLISGRGTNLQSLLEACAEPAFPAEIVLVISNQPGAAGLERAESAGCATRTIDHREYPDRPAFDAALDRALEAAGVDFVCLAGFMRVLSAGMVEHWRDRMINIHPSLLPSFKGLHAQEQALAAGVRIAGCTVHFVRPATDTGPIVVQAAVPVGHDDDAGTLAARVLEAEHRIYPLALGLIARGRVSVVDEKVVISGMETAAGTLINPPEA
ncbi:MAG: phosphoribosylglycinamide formyltransferase [Proteobacteria bacterium]|nr:phosphoribosylglycinamide formyltransferase [Pseudomonadota bacterium]